MLCFSIPSIIEGYQSGCHHSNTDSVRNEDAVVVNKKKKILWKQCIKWSRTSFAFNFSRNCVVCYVCMREHAYLIMLANELKGLHAEPELSPVVNRVDRNCGVNIAP